VRFLGIDFGWTSQPSGIALLEWEHGRLRLGERGSLESPQAVAQWVTDRLGSGPGMVAIDAPTIIQNPAGMRPCERDAHRRFGRYDAGCYPSNLASPFAARTTALSRALLGAGIRHAATIQPQQPGRYQIEVFPHAATIHLFGLSRILKYKKGPIAGRRAALAQFQHLLLSRLPQWQPKLHPISLPPVPTGGSALKAHEDQLDAILCAYIGAWWWYWGTARTLVLGDEQYGFLIVPVSEQTAATPLPSASAP
jgi:predicted RNase H-like nuclease